MLSFQMLIKVNIVIIWLSLVEGLALDLTCSSKRMFLTKVRMLRLMGIQSGSLSYSTEGLSGNLE